IVVGDLLFNHEIEIYHFSTDSRTLVGSPNEVFIAIKGKRDGHDYARSAWDIGTRNFILEKDLALPDSNILIVENSLKAFQEIAASHRKQFDIPVVGITGSNGKTTVKEWISTILSERFFVVKSPKSYNSQVGVPISLMELRKNHEVGVFEAGISKTGEMEKLYKMIRPTIGIFTNLGEAHDDGFESKDEKLHEKLKLFQSADRVLVRKEDIFFDKIHEALKEKIISWSLTSEADYMIGWTDRQIHVNDLSFHTIFQSPTQLENITHAIVTSLEMGMEHQEIQKGLDLIREVPMRLELKRGVNGCYILDDSYNNDEAGIRVALDYLETQKQHPNRVLILSDILHSGKSNDQLYTEISSLLKSKDIRLIGVGPEISSHKEIFVEESLFFDSTESLLSNLPDFRDEMILVKGARDFALERVVQRLQEKNHGTVLEVNFEALQYNLNQYRSLLQPQTKLMVMVKANAYGSGLLEVANFLQHQRIDMLGVAYVDEAIQLRKNGIHIPVMIMNPYIESFKEFEIYDLQAEIFSISHLKRLLVDTKKHPKVHLKIDTGMHRLGFSASQIPELIEVLESNPTLEVEGIFTHFSSSDIESEDAFTMTQSKAFDAAYSKLTEALGYFPTKHACNSSGIVRWPQYHFDMVRLGIGLHGFDPTKKLVLKNTSQLKTVVSQLQHLKAGESVGYARSGRIERDSKIAILPIGYEDGYSRVFGNGNASVLINGTMCPTLGNVCMDMVMVDVTEVEVVEGDEAIIFGAQPSIKELASWAGTIPYEILTNVSNRVKRVFVSE
ncbi:MAG: bifunctional UDP-N-acetylmuramoyl-tripeptide:D-alanyl-D-alanine ligase/alanine racemase, partial [Bacteroidota bacterium]